MFCLYVPQFYVLIKLMMLHLKDFNHLIIGYSVKTLKQWCFIQINAYANH